MKNASAVWNRTSPCGDFSAILIDVGIIIKKNHHILMLFTR